MYLRGTQRSASENTYTLKKTCTVTVCPKMYIISCWILVRDDTYGGMFSNSGIVMNSISLTKLLLVFLTFSVCAGWTSAASFWFIAGSPPLRDDRTGGLLHLLTYSDELLFVISTLYKFQWYRGGFVVQLLPALGGTWRFLNLIQSSLHTLSHSDWCSFSLYCDFIAISVSCVLLLCSSWGFRVFLRSFTIFELKI